MTTLRVRVSNPVAIGKPEIDHKGLGEDAFVIVQTGTMGDRVEFTWDDLDAMDEHIAALIEARAFFEKGTRSESNGTRSIRTPRGCRHPQCHDEHGHSDGCIWEDHDHLAPGNVL